MAKLNPYLSFRSEAKAALDFYQSVLGGELDVSTFGGTPMEGMPTPDEDKDLVMHGQLDTPGGLTIMASDTPSFMEYVAPSAGVTVALTGGPEDHDYIRERLREAVRRRHAGGAVRAGAVGRLLRTAHRQVRHLLDVRRRRQLIAG